MSLPDGAPSLESILTQVKSRSDLVRFVEALRIDHENNPGDWENATLPRFLEALAAWVESMEGYYRNQGLEFSEEQPWALFASMLLAARTYE